MNGFKRKQEKFENKYKNTYEILKNLDSNATKKIKKTYNNFLKEIK